MAEPAKRRATYADLEAVPAHLIGEIIDGQLVTRPRQTELVRSLMAALAGALTSTGVRVEVVVNSVGTPLSDPTPVGQPPEPKP